MTAVAAGTLARAIAADPNIAPRQPADGLQTLDRALAVLNLFDPQHEEWTAAEVAQELGLALGTVSRFMRGLAVRGFLIRSGRRYRLGFAAIELGQRAVATLGLRDRLRPITVRLAREAGETCVLIAPADSGSHVRVLDEAESTGAGFRIAVTLGHLLPLTEGAGKALLAFMPEQARDLALDGPLEDGLEHELEEIARQGWSMTYGEIEEGTWGVAAPIRTPAGEPLAGLALIAPTARYSKAAEARLVSLLLPAVAEAESRIGLRGDVPDDDAE